MPDHKVKISISRERRSWWQTWNDYPSPTRDALLALFGIAVIAMVFWFLLSMGWERSDAPRVCQRPWKIHNERYYAGDERAGGAFHTASKVLHSSNMATGDCRHRTKRDGRLDVPTGLWICQTSLSADLVDPAPGQRVSLAKSARRPQGSTAIEPVEFPVRRITSSCPHFCRNKRRTPYPTFRISPSRGFILLKMRSGGSFWCSYVLNRTSAICI
jgi:hypothetical protein